MNHNDTTDEFPIPIDSVPLDAANPLQADLDKAKKQVADYQSLIADFDNARKRLVSPSSSGRSIGRMRDGSASTRTLSPVIASRRSRASRIEWARPVATL